MANLLFSASDVAGFAFTTVNIIIKVVHGFILKIFYFFSLFIF